MNLTHRSDLLTPTPSRLGRAEDAAIDWMARHAVTCLRVSLGIIFLWFGALKLFPGFSPAQALAGQTLSAMSFGLVPPELSVPLLGWWECAMGIGLLTGHALRLTLLSLFVHMAGTTLPFLLLPALVFASEPGSLTIEGQYIIKNLVIISGALVVGAGLQGTRVVAGRGEESRGEEGYDHEEAIYADIRAEARERPAA